MEFQQLHSSSAGNAHIVTATNGGRLLIEAGVPWSKLLKALKHDLNGIEGVLCSHEHGDHSKALKDVRKAGIDVYASKGTLERVSMVGRRVYEVANETLIDTLDSFQVLCFDTNHDAAEPLGFIVLERATKEYLLFATDTSHITQRFNVKFNIIAIECSFDKDVLQERVDSEDINESLAKRLLTSHMEKQTTMRYLAETCGLEIKKDDPDFMKERQCREIHLLHMSGENIGNKEAVRKEFQDRFDITTKIVQRKDSRVETVQNKTN